MILHASLNIEGCGLLGVACVVVGAVVCVGTGGTVGVGIGVGVSASPLAGAGGGSSAGAGDVSVESMCGAGVEPGAGARPGADAGAGVVLGAGAAAGAGPGGAGVGRATASSGACTEYMSIPNCYLSVAQTRTNIPIPVSIDNGEMAWRYCEMEDG